MSESERPNVMSISEMLGQDEWYRGQTLMWFRVADMSEEGRQAAVERLMKFAYPMVQDVFKDLYAYGYPSGEQAQWDLERAEGQAEGAMASPESAREWMAQTPLYLALTSSEDPGEELELGRPETAAQPSSEALGVDRQVLRDLESQLRAALGAVEAVLKQLP